MRAQLDRETNLGYATSAQGGIRPRGGPAGAGFGNRQPEPLRRQAEEELLPENSWTAKRSTRDKYNNYKELTDDELEDMIDDLDTQIDTLTPEIPPGRKSMQSRAKKKAELTMRQNLIKSDTADAL